MKFFCLGSINIDHIYKCYNTEGNLTKSKSYHRFIGGKGLNQAFALMKAGVEGVLFHGIIGVDGLWMIDELKEKGFNTDNIIVNEQMTGHVIINIQEDDPNNIDNQVILHLGANAHFTTSGIDKFLEGAVKGDCLLIQEESNLVDYTLMVAKQKGMISIYNAAPRPPTIRNCWSEEYPSSWLVVNREEWENIKLQLARKVEQHEDCNNGGDCQECMLKWALELKVEKLIVTLGSNGCVSIFDGVYYKVNAMKVINAVDTTGAGDVFLAFLIKAYFMGIDGLVVEGGRGDVRGALRVASAASALAISRMGAMSSIPSLEEVVDYLSNSR